MKLLRAAVIGAGYLGVFHIQKYHALDGVELVAVVDVDLGRTSAFSAGGGPQPYTDHREILNKVDIVSIVTPTETHYPVAKDCLESGIHVLLEKPMTNSVAQADELIAIASRKGVVLQIGHLERFNPALLALDGVLGKPIFIESHRLASFKPRGTEVNVVLDLMIHDIDILLQLVQDDIKDIRAMGIPVLTDAVDIAHARLEFHGGCVANVTASRVSLEAMRKMRIFQCDRYLSIDYLKHSIAIAKKRQDTEAFDPGQKDSSPISYETQSFEKGDALLQELQAFVEAVRKNQAPVVTGNDGKRALEVALAIAEQIQLSPAM